MKESIKPHQSIKQVTGKNASYIFHLQLGFHLSRF